MLTELGRLTNDVKLETVQDGRKVLNNGLAISRGKNKKATFIDIVAWESTAELIDQYFKKGYEILVEGELINVKKKKGNLEYETVAIQVERIKFTNGNPRPFTLDENDIPDFLS